MSWPNAAGALHGRRATQNFNPCAFAVSSTKNHAVRVKFGIFENQ
jgi:hypothetical protein